MPDISKCTGEGCPKKHLCYRFVCEPEAHWQTYFSAPPVMEESGHCDYYWPTEHKDADGEKA